MNLEEIVIGWSATERSNSVDRWKVPHPRIEGFGPHRDDHRLAKEALIRARASDERLHAIRTKLANTGADRTLVDQAWSALLMLRAHGVEFERLGEPLVALAPDRSLVAEWARPDRRVGIGLEFDPSESNWFYVSTASAGGINASGLLVDQRVGQAFDWFSGS